MAELAQLITSLATLAGVGLSIYLALHNQKQLAQVKKQTNGMMSHVEAIVTKVGYQSGREEARVEGEAKAANLLANKK